MRVITAALVAALAVLGLATGAPATPATTDAQVLGHVTIDPDDPTIGYVTVRYICSPDFTHVWVSAKQAESRRPEHWLTEEGSGGLAAAWSHSHRNPATCDGQWHVGTFTIDQVEWGQGELEQGQAWVQFCLTSEAGPEGAVVWSMRFAEIK